MEKELVSNLKKPWITKRTIKLRKVNNKLYNYGNSIKQMKSHTRTTEIDSTNLKEWQIMTVAIRN